jgi:MoaA/NifB/PqqE/SkfB family radical SAM enzyme
MVMEQGFGKIDENLKESLTSLLNSSTWQEFLQAHKEDRMPEICHHYCSMQYPAEYHRQWKWAQNEGWKDKEHKITRADISFSNICNLTCTMCNDNFSTEWIKERREETKYKAWNFSESQIKELASLLSTCDMINIKGGEPLMNPRFGSFLKFLGDMNENIHIPVLSNGTVINNDILAQLSRFRNPTISFSLESTDDRLYRFIRGGEYTYTGTIIKNLNHIKKHYPKIKVKAGYLIGALNIENIVTDLKQLKEDGFYQINILTINGPIEQSIRIINREIRKINANKFAQFVLDNEEFFCEVLDNNKVNLIAEELVTDFNYIPNIVDLTNRIDQHIKMRNRQFPDLKITSISDISPNYFKNVSI